MKAFANMLSIDLYWSFRSPYSYLVLPRIIALTQEFRVDVRLRIVHPAAVRNPAYFKAMNPLARPYFFKDSARMAQYLGMPFRRPVPDPIVQDPVTLVIAKEQPHVHRLGRLGMRLGRSGAVPLVGPETAFAVTAAFAGLWLGTRVRARMGTSSFQKALFAVFLMLGLTNVLRSVV